MLLGPPSSQRALSANPANWFTNGVNRYFITAAPQCPFPDASLGAVLNAASFDAIYVQFCEEALPANFAS